MSDSARFHLLRKDIDKIRDILNESTTNKTCVPMPDGWETFNSGIKCDVLLYGACSCGATH